MKKIILLLIVMISMSGCYVTYRTPYYQRYPRYRYQERVRPGKIYRPYFMPGRW